MIFIFLLGAIFSTEAMNFLKNRFSNDDVHTEIYFQLKHASLEFFSKEEEPHNVFVKYYTELNSTRKSLYDELIQHGQNPLEINKKLHGLVTDLIIGPQPNSELIIQPGQEQENIKERCKNIETLKKIRQDNETARNNYVQKKRTLKDDICSLKKKQHTVSQELVAWRQENAWENKPDNYRSRIEDLNQKIESYNKSIAEKEAAILTLKQQMGTVFNIMDPVLNKWYEELVITCQKSLKYFKPGNSSEYRSLKNEFKKVIAPSTAQEANLKLLLKQFFPQELSKRIFFGSYPQDRVVRVLKKHAYLLKASSSSPSQRYQWQPLMDKWHSSLGLFSFIKQRHKKYLNLAQDYVEAIENNSVIKEENLEKKMHKEKQQKSLLQENDERKPSVMWGQRDNVAYEVDSLIAKYQKGIEEIAKKFLTPQEEVIKLFERLRKSTRLQLEERHAEIDEYLKRSIDTSSTEALKPWLEERSELERALKKL